MTKCDESKSNEIGLYIYILESSKETNLHFVIETEYEDMIL